MRRSTTRKARWPKGWRNDVALLSSSFRTTKRRRGQRAASTRKARYNNIVASFMQRDRELARLPQAREQRHDLVPACIRSCVCHRANRCRLGRAAHARKLAGRRAQVGTRAGRTSAARDKAAVASHASRPAQVVDFSRSVALAEPHGAPTTAEISTARGVALLRVGRGSERHGNALAHQPQRRSREGHVDARRVGCFRCPTAAANRCCF